ncbi:Flp family type IVb pilin [Thermodesulfitimonas autotrophica]|uniref:Flp family type IVb pilin n=1 Tax=Thermodesulfitimonas autotrophica TaxID=1894989 RepID=UPI002FE19CA5
MMGFLKRLVKEEEGQGMAEYGLILALIAVVAIAALVVLGGRIKNKFEEVSNNLQ